MNIKIKKHNIMAYRLIRFTNTADGAGAGTA